MTETLTVIPPLALLTPMRFVSDYDPRRWVPNSDHLLAIQVLYKLGWQVTVTKASVIPETY
jgi:hypothetical protein